MAAMPASFFVRELIFLFGTVPAGTVPTIFILAVKKTALGIKSALFEGKTSRNTLHG